MPRPSRIRNTIQDLIAASNRHDWSIDDVLIALRDHGVTADFSSVYRELGQLERSGLIRQVPLGDDRMHFEAPHAHHEHVRCDRCGSVSAVPGCSVKDAHAAAEHSTGYAITGHQLLFSGLCPGCSAQRTI